MTALITLEELRQLAARLKLHGLLVHWDELNEEEMPRIKTWLHWEETQGKKRGLERRLGQAHLGRFKPLSDFDWDWLERGDKDTVSDMMGLDFVQEGTNIILMGPNGVGKSNLAQNIAYQAVMQGHTALFAEALHPGWRQCPASSHQALCAAVCMGDRRGWIFVLRYAPCRFVV